MVSEGIDQLKVLLEAVNHLALKIIPCAGGRKILIKTKYKTITICEEEDSDYNLIVIVVEHQLRQD
jgi:hypothetical protein